MKLTQFTDYSFRTLIYLGLKNDRATVAEIARAFRISQNHLVKVVHQLSKKGLVKSVKGKDGGLNLEPQVLDMKIGDILLKTEPHFHLVECFDRKTNTCPIIGVCALEIGLHEAMKGFIEILNRKTLGDLLRSPTATARKKLLKLA